MKMIPRHVLEAVRCGDQQAITKYAQSGGHTRAYKVALSRAEAKRQEDLALDKRIQRLRMLVRMPWIIADAQIAALRSGYDALAD